MNRRELLKRLSAIPFVSMFIPMLNGQSTKGVSSAKKPMKELQFGTVEDFWVWAKQTQTPAKLAELEAWYKQWCDSRMPAQDAQTTVGVDDNGQFLWAAMPTHRVEPVFTEEQKKKYCIK